MKGNAKFSALAEMIKDAEEAEVSFELKGKSDSEGDTCSCGADMVCKDCGKPAAKCSC